MRHTRCIRLFILFAILGFLLPAPARSEEGYNAVVKRFPYQIPELTVIGSPTWYKVREKDTILDVARRFGLGYNEMDLLFPRMDAWVPPVGRRIAIPTFWVLPPTQHQQLLINIPELRLYFFDKNTSTVQTYPIGIGDEGWESPLGTFSIVEKRPNPSWYIPQSLQAKYGMAVMPPGPENPLGEFMMKFSAGAYGIHGTAMPWGVGRLVSHGCIRCYPEHIRLLYPQVPMGAKLEIIYEPLKFGQENGQIFIEAHPDVYRKIPDYLQYAEEKLARFPLANRVDRRKFTMAVRLQNGVPTNVTLLPSEDNYLKLVESIPD
ncbi:MAG: L,D-transpeptidase family protein [Syntrophobacteraceae bacterium]|nr:L,D-transpeptidase family protein [Syntrophobacteraceae bacterium]